ncbi:uncharacterized protein [Periplaneta americana]|uniref:uncharacterized protein n=1 Tax=Periplaneta americana TaxID=6978 RepID=UPI0037E7E286
MSPFTIVKNAVVLCFLNVCFSYKVCDISSDKVCSHVYKKRKLEIRRDDEPALILESRSFEDWQGVVEYKCRFQVKTTSGDGVIAVIQNLSLRSNEHGCLDYVKFKRKDGRESMAFCGQISALKPLNGDVSGRRIENISYVDAEGEIDTYIYVAKRKLNHNERLDLEIVYTSYRACSKVRTSYENCGPSSSSICIWKDLFHDGRVNCPIGCFDEDSCFRPQVDTKDSDVGTRVTIGAVTTVLVTFILFFICLWLLRHNSKLCWSSDCSGRRRQTPPASRVEMHPHVQDEESRSLPTPSAPADSSESAPVSTSEDKDLPPSYESLFPERQM